MLAGVVALTGCGAARTATQHSTAPLPPYIRPIPIGRAPAYRIAPTSAAVTRRRAIGGLACGTHSGAVYAIHLELFADRLVVPVPAGIGVAPPLRRSGAYVLGGKCTYPVWTLEPTGVVRIVGAHTPTLGTLFAIWGQPLTRTRLATFDGQVRAFVDGRRINGPPTAIALRRQAEIVLEIGGYIPPHPTYTFPPGL
ncbi:MAG TPA: hypothetical protein VGX45_13540 [Solirubrobacteraceae bacterium]|nr:hypothetical protein [Solirubrobacteraceae bacterium]